MVKGKATPDPFLPSGAAGEYLTEPGVKEIRQCLVRFFSARSTVVGVGFLAAPDIVLTCEHVVRAALGLPEGTPVEAGTAVNLDFPFLKSGLLSARVFKADAEKDIAALRLEADPPLDARPAPLVTPLETRNHRCHAFGFPEGHPKGTWVEGKLRGPRAEDGWFQIDAVPDSAYFVEPGFSGTPLWDDEVHGVVGMVAEKEQSVKIRSAACIPTDQLREFWPQLPKSQETESRGGPFLPPIPRVFVGRKEEIEEFKRALSALVGRTDSLPEDRLRKVFLIRGEGGMGKSTLLRQFVDLCRNYPLLWIYVDWDTEGVTSSKGTPAMMEVIARYIEKHIKKKLQRYENVRRSWEEVQERAGSWRGQFQWSSREAFEQFLKDNLSPEEYELYENHQRALSEAFISDLLQLAQERPLVFLWDSCETVWDFANPWIQKGLLRLCLQHRFLFVFAGRLPERPVEVDLRDALGDKLYRKCLDRFTPSDIAYYFGELGIPLSEEKAKRIYEATLGIPLAVGIIADVLLERGDLEKLLGSPEQFAQITEQEVIPLITTRFLKYLVNEPERRAAYSLALLRETEKEDSRRFQFLREWWFKLGLIRSGEEFSQLYRSLRSRYSFLSTGDIHPDVRFFIRRDLRSSLDVEICERGREICDFHIRRCEEELQTQYGKDRAQTKRYEHTEWQQWLLDLVEFLLWLRNYQQGMERLIEHYILGMQFGSGDFHQRLLSLFRDPIFYDELSPHHRELVRKLANLSEWLSSSELDAEKEQLLGSLKGEAQIAGRLSSAEAAIRGGRLSRAYDELRQAEESYQRLSIRNEDIEKRLGELYFLLGREMMRSSRRKQTQQESLEIFQKAKRWSPGNPYLPYFTGIVLINLGYFEEAQWELERAKGVPSLDKKVQEALKTAGRFKPLREAKRLTMIANTRNALGEFDIAEQLFRRALQLSQTYIPARVKLVHLLRQEARIEQAFELLSTVDADQITDKRLKAAVYDAYGALYASQERWEDAIQFYKKAIECSPEYINPYIGLGRAYIRQRQPEKALIELKKGWEIKMRSKVPIRASLFWAQNNMGIAYLMANQHTGAVISFQFAETLCRAQLTRESRLYQTQIGLGLALMGQQRYSEAIEILNRLDQRFPEIRRARGFLQEVLKDIELIGAYEEDNEWRRAYNCIAILL